MFFHSFGTFLTVCYKISFYFQEGCECDSQSRDLQCYCTKGQPTCEKVQNVPVNVKKKISLSKTVLKSHFLAM